MNVICARKVMPVVLGLSVVWSAPALSYCLDGVAIGMFTEREFTELDAPPRSKVQDKKLNALLKRGMKATGANLISVEGDTKKQALAAAAEQDLSVLAYLDLEAASEESALPGPIRDISSVAKLQILAAGDGKVLGEGSDLSETPGVDIEDALPAILTIKTVETLASQAEKAACTAGLPSAEAVVADAKDGAAADQTQGVDRALTTDIQHALIAAGYDPGLPDGVMGQQTGDAIKHAEMKLKMPPTGQPSSTLLHKLTALDRSLIGEVQQALFELGRLESRPSRVLDSNTERAIETAEFEFGLQPADGLPDHDLLRVLRANLPEKDKAAEQDETAALSPDSADEDPGLRLRIEELLFKLGYFDGPPAGIATIDSEQAIWRAERDFGLEADGLPDKELWRLLDEKANG